MLFYYYYMMIMVNINTVYYVILSVFHCYATIFCICVMYTYNINNDKMNIRIYTDVLLLFNMYEV